MSWRNVWRTQEDWRRQEAADRVRGYDDGFYGKPARSKLAIYQASYRRGMERRRDLLLNDLDDAS